MLLTILKSKIHRVKVTEANLEYIGSITIDEDLMDAAGIVAGERVQVVDNINGARLETYVIAGKRGSGCICMNGAAAHLIHGHLRLRLLNLTWHTRNVLLTAYGATVIYRLAYVYSHPILVLAQPFHVQPHLLIHRLHLLRPCRHVTLIGSLCRGSHLRQPCLANVLHRQRSGLLCQSILPYQRVVTLRCLLTFLQRLPLNRQRQRYKYKK